MTVLVSGDEVAAEESTMFMPETRDTTEGSIVKTGPAASGEDMTMLVSGDEIVAEDATMFMPETRDTTEGSVVETGPAASGEDMTALVSGDEVAAAEEATMFMPEARDTTEGRVAKTKLATPDALPAQEDDLTQVAPVDSPPAFEDETVAMPKTDTVEADGLTQAMSGVSDTTALDDKKPPHSRATVEADKTIASGPKKPRQDTMAMVTLKIGQLLQDRYRLDKILGRGGFGAAFLAEDVKLKRACVVKQMLTPKGISPTQLERHRANFQREASLLVQLNQPGHPNIPEIYDYFFEGDDSYLVMKYIEGRNLKDILHQENGKIPWRQAVRYAIDVCSSLNYMQTTGNEPVMHRDIKPANIILGNDGRIWLIDFGLAKAEAVQGTEGDMMMTQASGSLGYTPLERVS